MMISRIVLLAGCCALMPSAWAGAGLTSAGVDPTAGNNNAPEEPTLAQVAPVANQGQPGAASAGTNTPVLNPAVAGTASANGQQAANGAADGAKPAAPVVVVPTPPPPPPDPSTLPVSVIKPLNKSAENAPAKADAESTVTTMAKPSRHVAPDAPAEPMPAPGRAPTPATARAQQPAPAARAEPARTAADAAAAIATPSSATADGSANGLVFYTGMGIAGIILALSFVGFMRAGKDSGRPRG
jgi:hypothetical protein